MTTNDKLELSAGGNALWAALVHQDQGLGDDQNPLRHVALEACRAKDRCDLLEVVVRSESVMIDNGKGLPVAHPAWVEARQQANIMKQLIASLRLPDEATGRRPQRHLGAAGTRQPNGAGAARDRLKAV